MEAISFKRFTVHNFSSRLYIFFSQSRGNCCSASSASKFSRYNYHFQPEYMTTIGRRGPRGKIVRNRRIVTEPE